MLNPSYVHQGAVLRQGQRRRPRRRPRAGARPMVADSRSSARASARGSPTPTRKAGSEEQILDDQWLGTLLEIGAVRRRWRCCGSTSARSVGCTARARSSDGRPTAGSPWRSPRRRSSRFAVGHAHVRRVRVRAGDVPLVRAARLRGGAATADRRLQDERQARPRWLSPRSRRCGRPRPGRGAAASHESRSRPAMHVSRSRREQRAVGRPACAGARSALPRRRPDG